MTDNDLFALVKRQYENQGFTDEAEFEVRDHETGGKHIVLYGYPWRGGFSMVVRPSDKVSYSWEVFVINAQQRKGFGRRLINVGEGVCAELGIDLIVHNIVLTPRFLEKMGCQRLLKTDKKRFAERLHGIVFSEEKSPPYYKTLSVKSSAPTYSSDII